MNQNDREYELKLLGWCAHGIGASVLILIAVAYHFTVAAVVESREEDNAARIALLEHELSNGTAVRSEYEALTRSLADIERRAEMIRQRIPDEPNEADFLRQITSAANREGLEIRDYQVGLVGETATHSQVDVRLACQGNYVAVCGFLDYLAALPRITTVQKLQVTSNLTDESYPVEITLWLYFGAKGPQQPKAGA